MKRESIVLFLTALWSTLTFITCTNENPIPEKNPSLFFPNAQNFVVKTPTLSPDKAASIETALEVKLRPDDFAPTFHIATNRAKQPLGAVLFLGVDSPQGVLDGGVGLDMQGKVVRVEIYEPSVADREFLDQFVGKGIEDAFQVGKDVKAVSGQEAICQLVARLPQKALLLTHALFPKKSQPKLEEADPEPIQPVGDSSPEIVEPETLIELMDTMKEAYDIVREYFQTHTEKQSAVRAAKQLVKYIEFIDYFEPPNNPNETEEYTYFQEQVAAALRQFVDALETDGLSDNSRSQWERVLDLVNKAHLRFSIDEVDLDEDLE